jgi:hypothetical protein
LWIEPITKLVKVLLVMAAVVAAGWIARNVIRQRRIR